MSSSPPPTNRKTRICTREACEPCRKGRSKCDGNAPCSRCTTRGLDCEYQARVHRSKRSLRDEIDALKERQREQDALLEALQDPLRRDTAMRMLQEKSRAGSASNPDAAGQAHAQQQGHHQEHQRGQNQEQQQREQQGIKIKQEEIGYSGIGGWGSTEDVGTISASTLQSFTSASTTHATVAATPWTASIGTDSITATGLGTGPFQLSSVTQAFPGHLGHFDHRSTDTHQSPIQSHMPSAEYHDTAGLSLRYRLQQEDWNKGAGNHMGSQPWVGQQPAIASNMSLQHESTGQFPHGTHVFQTNWGRPSNTPYNNPSMNSTHDMTWTPAQPFAPATMPGTSSYPPSTMTTRPISPASLRTHSGSTIASSATTVSSATSMTSAAPSIAGTTISPSMKPPPLPFSEPMDESGRQQNIPGELSPDVLMVEGSDARERHRVASARSWSKQKSAIADLQATVSRVEAQHTALREEYAQVQKQVHDVHDALLKHVGCNDPAISMWLKRDEETATSLSRGVPGYSRMSHDFSASGDSAMMGPDGKARSKSDAH